MQTASRIGGTSQTGRLQSGYPVNPEAHAPQFDSFDPSKFEGQISHFWPCHRLMQEQLQPVTTLPLTLSNAAPEQSAATVHLRTQVEFTSS